jgi:outer membrane lipoprotein SlyB
MKLQTMIVPLFAAAVASGCAGPDMRYGSNDYRYTSARANEGYYAVIDSIESGRAGNDNSDAIAGTIIGSLIGGVVGHQFGSGRGNDVATVAGAVGGALAGHEIGKANGRQDVYFIRVRFDDRGYQTVTQDSLDGLRVGDSVRIERDRVRRY